jgi:hypothetical protein
MKIKLTKAEVQSGHSRIKWAEGLITQLPKKHEGRNSWLLNYGKGPEAYRMRQVRNLKFKKKTQACETTKGPEGNHIKHAK